ncbi:MAG: hypothetical protein ACYDCN_01045 [Bacteroidia bacterium]
MNKKENWEFLAAFLAFKIEKYLIQAEQTKQTPSRWLVCSGKRNPQDSIIVSWAQKVISNVFFCNIDIKNKSSINNQS